MADVRLTRFKTPDDERRFDALYARLRAERYPAPPREVDIETPLGTAHVSSWAGAGLPVLLVPGWGGTALMWAPMLTHGFGGRPVHAIDLIGDVGLSLQRAPVTAIADHVPWLDAVADGLDLERMHVVGSSYGGALTMQWAAHAPGRIVTATLLDPGGLVDIDLKRFIAWGMKIFAASVAPMPIRRRAARRLHAPSILDTELMQLARLASMRTKPHEAPGGATALPDAVLRAIDVPTLALLAEHSAIMDPITAAARVRDLLPDARVEVLPGASHMMPTDDAERIAARVRRFLDAQATAVEAG